MIQADSPVMGLRRAQVYKFLADAFQYPRENWTEELDDLRPVAEDLDLSHAIPAIQKMDLPALQAAHRSTFGAAGSLCYETEYGLPHEYRQSQEMADLAGFYRAFGFDTGGGIRERPDHVAVELEFMCALGLKEAYALEQLEEARAEICREAQANFLRDHLGRWFGLFEQSMDRNGAEEPYGSLSTLAGDFIAADMDRMGVEVHQTSLDEIAHTPFNPDSSCAACCLPGKMEPMDIENSSPGNPG